MDAGARGGARALLRALRARARGAGGCPEGAAALRCVPPPPPPPPPPRALGRCLRLECAAAVGSGSGG